MISSAKNYDYLIQKIDEFVRKYYFNKIVRGSIYLALVLFVGYIILVLAEYYGNFNSTIRTIFVYGFGLSILSIIAYYIAIPALAYFKLGKVISNEQASELIGKHFQGIQDKLLNTLQLKQLSASSSPHLALIEASINQKIIELKPIPFTSAVQLGENKKYLKWIVVPVLVIILILLIAPHIIHDSTQRLVHYDQFFAKKAPFQFQVLNTNLSAIQGDDFELKVKLNGNEIPQDVYIKDGSNTFKLDKESITQFQYTFKNVQQTKAIQLIAGEFSSSVYTIDVKLKATLLNFDVILQYPAYLDRKNETLANSGDLTVPIGTHIKWNLNVKNTHQVDFKLDEKQYIINQTSEGVFSLPYRALKNINYSIRPINRQGIGNDSVSYQLRVIPDLNPSIEVSERADSVNNKLVYFVGQLGDDHGFSKLNFTYKVLGNQYGDAQKAITKQIPIDKKVTQANFFYAWDVSEANAKPGQEVEYYFEIFDNDGVNGPKSTRYASKIYKLQSEKEIEQKIEATSDDIKQKMEMAVRKAGEIEQDAKRINRDLINKKSLTFEEKKQVEKLLQKQRELETLVKDIQKSNTQNLLEQQENKALKQDIIEKQKQIEHLFNNVLNKKTQELLTNIQNMLEQNNKTKTQEQVSNMQMDNKSLQKELDRVLELYKQLELEQKLSNSIDKLEKLAKKQEEQAQQSLNKNAKSDELIKQQSDIKQSLEDLKKSLSELNEKKGFQNPEKEQSELAKQQEQISKDLENKN